MDSRTKLQKALNHEDGPIPIDFGSNPVTSMHASIVAKLRDYYSLEKKPVKINDPYQMLGEIEDDLAEALNIDVRGIWAPNTMFGFPLSDWKQWTTSWGQDVLVPGKFEITEDERGYYIYPQGDRSARPSGHLPKNGFYFDTIIRQHPIDEDKLDPEDNLEEFGPLTDSDILYYQTEIAKARKTDNGTVLTMPGTGIGDIALVPAPFMKDPKGIRDIAEWYMSTVARKDYVKAVFEEQSSIAVENLKKLYEIVGNDIDVMYICGTDFGTQNGTFCSVDAYIELWKPAYRKMNDWIHENTNWKTFKHSCGSVITFIDELIDSGFDILNPVQCSALNMEPKVLKDRFGDRITFWGGGVDTQHTLPFDTPENVKKQVLERCEIFSKNGGFVFNAIHNVQANTPIENVVAMFEAVKEFGKQ